MEPLVSVIVPIYNVSKYLKKCLDSLLKQTYTNLEILLINNGSNDGSEDICLDYCQKDERFRLYNIEHKGASFARNFGIRNSSGELLSFIDSDDYIEPSYYSMMIEKIGNYDIVFCRFFLEENGTNIKYFETNLHELSNNPKQLDLFIVDRLYEYKTNDFIKRDCIFGSCWRSIFRKDIIKNNNLLFNEKLILGEDLIFIMRYLSFCGSCLIVNKYLYHYVNRKGSVTSVHTVGYNQHFWEIYYPLFVEEKNIIEINYERKNKREILDFLKYQFSYRFVINELVLNTNPNISILKTKLNKAIVNYNVRLISKQFSFSFKERVFCKLINKRHFWLLKKLLKKHD